MAGEKTINCKQPTEKRLAAFASEIVNNTIKSLEKAVSSMCRTKIKAWAMMAASGAMDLKTYTKWLNAIESELKNTRTINSDLAVVLRYVLNILQRVTNTTRWAFKVKSDRHFEARQVVLGWRQKHRIDCRTTLFVCRFDLPVIASAKKVNIPDV